MEKTHTHTDEVFMLGNSNYGEDTHKDEVFMLGNENYGEDTHTHG